MNKKRNLIRLILPFLLTAIFAGCTTNKVPVGTNSKPMPPIVAPNQKPDESKLAWTLVSGRRQTIADFKGKVLILDFWATYCPPCEEEIPHLVETFEKNRADLQVVGLHVGDFEDRANIAGFVSKYRMSYALGYPDKVLSEFLLQGDDVIPQTFVFDREGNLVKRFVGFSPQIKTDLDAAIQTALQK